MFRIEKKIKNALGRAGVLTTPHGEIKTPAFAAVGTKATVKTLTPEQVKETGSQVVLSNTFHLYLKPGEKVISKYGGLHKFMNWHGPIITDSGGFQVFSLGEAFGHQISKISKENFGEDINTKNSNRKIKGNKNLVEIGEEGVKFKNPTDGKYHFLTPEKSIEIQKKLGADIIFAFDECTSPLASYEYQKEAMERTHRWAKRSLDHHKRKGEGRIKRLTKAILRVEDEEEINPGQQLFGIVQGGRFEDLRKKSAKEISQMNFDGFGIGGSFEKEDIDTALKWVNSILPEKKPRHLLGIGEPRDILEGIENGADLFDCVLPTRIARNGGLLTKEGKINILNRKFVTDYSPIEKDCGCYSCKNFSRSYLSHLFRSKEILGLSLATTHNLYFINNLFSKIREKIIENNFFDFKEEFLRKYEQ